MKYNFTNRAGDTGEIILYGPVGESFFGDGISDADFAREIRSLGNVKRLEVHLNSEGGDVFAGTAIYNTLAAHPAEVEVHIDGVALSIASVIAMAGDRISMARNGYMMIHKPHGIFAGDADHIRKQADLLDAVQAQIVDTYASRRGLEVDQVDAWVNAETWFNGGAEALEAGMIDQVTDPLKIAAAFDLSQFKNTPSALQAKADGVKPAQTSNRSRASAAIARMKAGIIASD
ncbi:MAG: Clp protease ClpP [Pontiella sp.]|nr:Clp protease ClpP [Pontiella sp.]